MRATAIVCLVAFTSALPTARAEEPKGDLDRLQGSWKGKVGPEHDVPATLTLKGTAAVVSITREGKDDLAIRGELKVDDKAHPKTIDWVKFRRPDGGVIPESKGLYRLEEDVLTICSGFPGTDRPTEFKEGKDGPPVLTTWDRVKDTGKNGGDAILSGDLAKFQGKWAAAIGADKARTLEMDVKGKAVSARWSTGDGPDIELKGELQLDPEAKPARIDFVHFKRSDGETVPDSLGIYVIEGDDIKVCIGEPDGDRPAEFKAGDDMHPLLLAFKKKP